MRLGLCLPFGVPYNQSLMWSHAALAADMAEDSFRLAITAAPRFWTVGKNTVFNHSSSLMTWGAGVPSMVAWEASGYWVDEWLPQMMTFLTEEVDFLAFSAS